MLSNEWPRYSRGTQVSASKLRIFSSFHAPYSFNTEQKGYSIMGIWFITATLYTYSPGFYPSPIIRQILRNPLFLGFEGKRGIMTRMRYQYSPLIAIIHNIIRFTIFSRLPLTVHTWWEVFFVVATTFINEVLDPSNSLPFSYRQLLISLQSKLFYASCEIHCVVYRRIFCACSPLPTHRCYLTNKIQPGDIVSANVPERAAVRRDGVVAG